MVIEENSKLSDGQTNRQIEKQTVRWTDGQQSFHGTFWSLVLPFAPFTPFSAQLSSKIQISQLFMAIINI